MGYGDAGLCESLACSLVPFLLGAAFGGPQAQDWMRAYCDDAQDKMIGLKLFKMFTMIESACAYSRRVAHHNAANPPGSALHALSLKVYCTEITF